MHSSSSTSVAEHSSGFVRELGLFDSVMIVIGTMLGSGIFIVSADMSRFAQPADNQLAVTVANQLDCPFERSAQTVRQRVKRAGLVVEDIPPELKHVLGHPRALASH